MGGSSIGNAISVGTTLGNYEVVEMLGKGGMGEVYLAKDKRSGRKIALKLLAPDAIEDKDRVRRFKREARAIMALNHPNIVTIYDSGEENSIHFIATEYIKGETLRQQLARRIPLRDSLAIVIQMAIALEFAHEHGIIHRDIKPENVMIRPDSIIKVLDFGLAKRPARLVEHETWPAEAGNRKDRRTDRTGHDYGDGRLYVARAGAGGYCRQAERHFQSWRGAL